MAAASRPVIGRRPITDSLAASLAASHAAAIAAAAYGFAGTAAAQPAAVPIRLDAVSCSSGPLAIVLPRHYPSLHGIGKHKVTDLEVRSTPTGPVTLRRIEYFGLRLDLRIAGVSPQSYEMVELDVFSRRWNVGPLSVGRKLDRELVGPASQAVPETGTVMLLGRGSSIELVLRNGRIDRASYRCAPREAS